MARGAVDPAVCGGDVEVAGAAAEAAHVAYPGGGVGEAFQLLHSVGLVGTRKLVCDWVEARVHGLLGEASGLVLVEVEDNLA